MLSSAPGLHVADYVVFVGMLLVSLGIGVYYSLSGGRQRTTEEYLMGNRQMSVLPVTLSYTVSFISTILLLGFPAEIYSFGAEITTGLIGVVIGNLLAVVVFVPVFYPLRMTSVNEYLSLRFDSHVVKGVGSFCALWGCVLYSSNVYFGPSTAIEAVTGFPAWMSIVIGSVVSVCYTTIGGFKAVIWTDVFQSIIMFVGLLALVIQGAIAIGGLDVAFIVSKEWGRLNFFNWDMSLHTRVTTWSAVIRSIFVFLFICGAGQPFVQRYSAMPTQAQASKVVIGAIPGNIVLSALAFILGWIAFAYYTLEGCDPVSSGHLTNPNQVVPLFVMEVFNLPGAPGLFLAACAASSLSSASSSLNAASAVTWEDILKPLFFKNAGPRKSATIAKIVVLFYGALATAIGISFSGLGGTVVQIMGTFAASCDGVILAVFLMGLFTPWVTWKGIATGSVVGATLGLWVAFGSYSIEKHLQVLPTNTANCFPNATLENSTYPMTVTDATWSTTLAQEVTSSETTNQYGISPWLYSLYSISFMWLFPLVSLVVVIVATIVSLITGGHKTMHQIDARTIHPWVRRFFTLDSGPLEQVKSPSEGQIVFTNGIKSKESVAVTSL